MRLIAASGNRIISLRAQESIRRNLEYLDSMGVKVVTGQELEFVLMPPLKKEVRRLLERPDREGLPDSEYDKITATGRGMTRSTRRLYERIFIDSIRDEISKIIKEGNCEGSLDADLVVGGIKSNFSNLFALLFKLTVEVKDGEPVNFYPDSFNEPVDKVTYRKIPEFLFLDRWHVLVQTLQSNNDYQETIDNIRALFCNYTESAQGVIMEAVVKAINVASDRTEPSEIAAIQRINDLVFRNKSVFAWQYQDIIFNDLRLWAVKNGIEFHDIETEFGRWSFELSLLHSDPMNSAANMEHLKLKLKEIADRVRVHMSVAAVPWENLVPNGAHIHASLWSADGVCLLEDDFDKDNLMREVLDGVAAFTNEAALCFLPNENSHQRVVAETYRRGSAAFPPKCIAFAKDKECRTKRYVGRTIRDSDKSWHFELRLPGSDNNSYADNAGLIAGIVYGLESYIVDHMMPVPVTGYFIEQQHISVYDWSSSISDGIRSIIKDLRHGEYSVDDFIKLSQSHKIFFPRQHIKQMFDTGAVIDGAKLADKLGLAIVEYENVLEPYLSKKILGDVEISEFLNSIKIEPSTRESRIIFTPQLVERVKRQQVLPGALPEDKEYSLPTALADSKKRIDKSGLAREYLGSAMVQSLSRQAENCLGKAA